MGRPLNPMMTTSVRWHQPRWLILLSLVLVLSWVAVAQHAHANDTGHHLDCALCLKQGLDQASLPSLPPALPEHQPPSGAVSVSPLGSTVDLAIARARAPPR